MLENNIIISTKVKEKNERNVSDQIIQIAKENNGVVTTADITERGILRGNIKTLFEFGKIRTNSTRCLYFAGNMGG
ncbi:MAG: type IV toxin-antitoxin system AbiEi family antitoxin domain-containing protein [Lachnospira sp.]